MPIYKCSSGPERWRIGSGDCIFTSKEKAMRAYIAYLAQNPREAENPISFDFDSTLTVERWKRLARLYVNLGKKVYIITGRTRILGDRVYKMAEELGIPRDQVIFTGGRDKYPFIKEYRIHTHYDNNPDQINLINNNTNAIGILV